MPANSRGRESVWLFYALTWVVAMHFALDYVQLLSRAFNYQTYIYGLVDYPFRTRRFMAWVFRGALFVGQMLHLRQDSDATRGPIWWTDLAIVTTSLFIAVWATRRSIQLLLGNKSVWTWAAMLVPYMAYFNFLLVGEIRVQTPYDLPSVAFYAVALYAILARFRLAYYAVFIVATLNRETTLFLPLFFFLRQLREDVSLGEALKHIRPIWTLELVAQMAMWEGIREWSKSTVEGGQLQATTILAKNYHFLMDPLHWPTMASVFGFLWIPYLLLFRQVANPFLKRCALLTPLWFMVMLGVGDLLEIRIHSEWISYVAICMALLLNKFFMRRTVETPTV